ncbi:MAG: Kelch repeat-containing protein [Candidatus Bathyarchaeia archaeon]
MKIAWLLLALVLAASFSFSLGLHAAFADSSGFPPTSGILIHSPTNTTYTSGAMVLNVSLSGLCGANINASMVYSLDGMPNVTLPVTVQSRKLSFVASYNGYAALPELTPGPHSITVYSEYNIYNASANGVFIPKDTRLDSNTVHFTIASDAWVQRAPMPTARTSLGAAAVNGKVYAIGGYSSSQDKFLTVNEAYDPAADIWTAKASMPTPRGGFAIATYNDRVYVIGGQTRRPSGPEEPSPYTNATEAYDPATDTWTTRAPIPTSDAGLSAAVAGGKIYVTNGILNFAYDPSANSWTTAAPLPTAVGLQAIAAVDDKIYVFSGSGFNSSSPGLTQIYDPRTDGWSSGAPMPISVEQPAAAATTGASAQKAIYLIGGSSDFFVPGETLVQVYFPGNDSWSSAASLLMPRAQLGAAVVDDVIYAVGGTRSRTPIPAPSSQGGGSYLVYEGLSDNEAYTPVGYGAPDPSYQALTPKISPSSAPPPSPEQTQPPPAALQTETPSFSPSPTPTLTPSLAAPEQQAASSPEPQQDAFQMEMGIAAAVAAGATALFLWRKRKQSLRVKV